ncbi:MAG: hypothetical protein ABWX68_08240 [Arthrobacter sp.]|uniref:hypothetical protein n=1 Tax=Arthrobacter sp. TaxID=1667 RepID=UPI003496DA35
MTIIHLPSTASKVASPMPSDVRPLVWALSRMEPEAFAVILPGETVIEAQTRRAAGLDILDELLLEFPGELDDRDALAGLTALHVFTAADQVDRIADLLAGLALRALGGAA